jgi:hypothetical protein
LLVSVNVAVTVLFALMVMVAGFAEPVRSPLQPLHRHPGSGAAVSVTAVPGA